MERETKILDVGIGYRIMAIILAMNKLNIITGEPKIDPLRDEYYKHGKKPDVKEEKQNCEEHYYFEKDYKWKILACEFDGMEHIKFKHFNAQNFRFQDDFFDAIFMYDILQHIEKKRVAHLECLKVIKLKGLLCFIETNRDGIEYFMQQYGFSVDLVEPEKFLKGIDTNIHISRKILQCLY
ncbi:MAG: class I SAM-dependent methyltransferase [Promethearchaeota archaeon]